MQESEGGFARVRMEAMKTALSVRKREVRGPSWPVLNNNFKNRCLVQAPGLNVPVFLPHDA